MSISRFWKETNGGVRFVVVAFVLLLIFMGTTYYFDNRLPKASDYMWLPSNAQVLAVEPGEWSGDAEIAFQIPPGQMPEENLKSIWYQNVKIKMTRQDKLSRWADDGKVSHLLSYDPPSNTYHYAIRFAR